MTLEISKLKCFSFETKGPVEGSPPIQPRLIIYILFD